MEIKRQLEFKEKFKNAITCGDSMKIVDELRKEELIELMQALELKGNVLGLTMRDDYHLELIKQKIGRMC